MKKKALAFSLAAMLLLLTACATGTVYSRIGTSDRITLTIKHLNGNLDQTLFAKAGEAIAVNASDLTGEMRLTIALHDQEPIYDGSNLPELFTVNVSEQGEYTISVSGEGAGKFVFEVVHS